MSEKMIAYCGLDCKACDAYRATVTDDDTLREKTAKLWTELNGVEITKDMINCEGCKGDGKKTPFCAFLCEIRKCAMEKKAETCGSCEGWKGCAKLSMITGNNPEAVKNLEK